MNNLINSWENIQYRISELSESEFKEIRRVKEAVELQLALSDYELDSLLMKHNFFE
jgi:hypothetical protein